MPLESNSRLREGEADANTILLDSDIRNSDPTCVEEVVEFAIFARGLPIQLSLQLVLAALFLRKLALFQMACHLEL
jgi:hypothetical protein